MIEILVYSVLVACRLSSKKLAWIVPVIIAIDSFDFVYRVELDHVFLVSCAVSYGETNPCAFVYLKAYTKLHPFLL